MAGWWRREHERFEGFLVMSPPGLQEALIGVLQQHVQSQGAVLDLGSGSGVMAARLESAGMTNVQTVARDPTLCGDARTAEQRPPEHPDTLRLDLSGRFADHFDRKFAAVTSSELIEHLPAPRVFIAELARLLEPGGIVVLTTPNVSNWIGRLWFLAFGELRWFDAAQSRALNHISPILHAQMCLMLEEAGFELLDSRAAGTFTGPVAAALLAPLFLPFLVLHRKRAWGDCMVYVARLR